MKTPLGMDRSPVPTVFLDRDGVLNEDLGYVYRISDLKILPGVIEGLSVLKKFGYRLVVITNQSGIARGYFSEEDVRSFHKELAVQLETRIGMGAPIIDSFHYCPHHPDANNAQYAKKCQCRKPGTLLVKNAEEIRPYIPEQSFFIGDKESDVMCGKACGLKTIQIVGAQYPRSDCADFFARDLVEAADQIIGLRTS